YYSEQSLTDAMKSIYNLELTVDDKNKLGVGERAKKIKELLEEKGKDSDAWKVLLGNHIAEKMHISEIDKELQAIFERIRSKLS
ncbi:MAG TPA: hypothetical protein VJ571_05505, partial [Candidatus Nitrosotalea sp.]|nr:hypothetical protein [Candidatus Nitrosotalea sp.]